MYEDDLVAALQQSVKQEIIENYLRERRIVEEEIALLCETVSAFHGGLANRERRRERLARALVLPGAAARFFALAGLGEPPQMPATAAPALCLLPRGWTRPQRYQRLVRHLYRTLWRTGQELAAEREKVLRLRQEINEDILAFERNHDMLTLTTVLRSMDPAEVQRRHILGVNFSAAETAVSAANLSFHPVSLERLGLHPDLGRELARPRPPAEVLREAEPILRGLCRANPCEVDALWHAGVKAAAPPGLKPLEEL
jgi:hypothetical protein